MTPNEAIRWARDAPVLLLEDFDPHLPPIAYQGIVKRYLIRIGMAAAEIERTRGRIEEAIRIATICKSAGRVAWLVDEAEKFRRAWIVARLKIANARTVRRGLEHRSREATR